MAQTHAGKKILLVDDQPVVRAGLRTLVEAEPDLEICGEAIDTADGRAEARLKQPDLAVLDIAVEGDRGLEFIEAVKTHTLVLVFTLREESIYAERCLQAGALGYLSKREPTARVMHAIRRVLAGKVCVSERVTEGLLDRLVSGSSTISTAAVQQLSDRELEVFELFGQGVTTAEIAAALSLSVKTVQGYHASIKKTLNLSNHNQLIRRAVHYVLEGQ